MYQFIVSEKHESLSASHELMSQKVSQQMLSVCAELAPEY